VRLDQNAFERLEVGSVLALPFERTEAILEGLVTAWSTDSGAFALCRRDRYADPSQGLISTAPATPGIHTHRDSRGRAGADAHCLGLHVVSG
jgi:hypothetical protein